MKSHGFFSWYTIHIDSEQEMSTVAQRTPMNEDCMVTINVLIVCRHAPIEWIVAQAINH